MASQPSLLAQAGSPRSMWRPMRPLDRLARHPASIERVLKPHPECAPATG
jgi:hypothetical protein